MQHRPIHASAERITTTTTPPAPRWTPPAAIDAEFGYHPATDVTGPAHDEVRAGLRQMAHYLNAVLPECPRKTEAIGKLREAMWAANSAIACYGSADPAWQQATRERLGMVTPSDLPPRGVDPAGPVVRGYVGDLGGSRL